MFLCSEPLCTESPGLRKHWPPSTLPRTHRQLHLACGSGGDPAPRRFCPLSGPSFLLHSFLLALIPPLLFPLLPSFLLPCISIPSLAFSLVSHWSLSPLFPSPPPSKHLHLRVSASPQVPIPKPRRCGLLAPILPRPWEHAPLPCLLLSQVLGRGP